MRWHVQFPDRRETAIVDGRSLEEVATAHPTAHSIWRYGQHKKTLAMKYLMQFYHVRCFARYQRSCPADKWPSPCSYIVSGGQTIIRDAVCPHCRKPVLKSTKKK